MDCLWLAKSHLGQSQDLQRIVAFCRGLRTDSSLWSLIGRNGSDLVFRKIEQDVAAFRRFILENADKDNPDLPGGPAELH